MGLRSWLLGREKHKNSHFSIILLVVHFSVFWSHVFRVTVLSSSIKSQLQALDCTSFFTFPDILILKRQWQGHLVPFTESLNQRQLVPTLSCTTKDTTEETVASLSGILYIPCPFIKYSCFDISGCTPPPPRLSTTWYTPFSPFPLRAWDHTASVGPRWSK